MLILYNMINDTSLKHKINDQVFQTHRNRVLSLGHSEVLIRAYVLYNTLHVGTF